MNEALLSDHSSEMDHRIHVNIASDRNQNIEDHHHHHQHHQHHVVAEEEEEEEALWSELKDHSPFEQPLRQPTGASTATTASSNGYLNPNGSTSTNTTTNTNPIGSLPSLRSNIHLPAISSVFQNFRNKAAPSPMPNETIPDENGKLSNLDGFLINLYNYFYHKGFWCIVMVEMVSLFTGFFSVSFTSFLLGCVEWHELIQCQHNPDNGCKQELSHFVSCKVDNAGVKHLLVAFYFMVFLVYWAFRTLQCLKSIQDAYHMGNFYRYRLLIDERKIQTVQWDEIVTKVLDLVRPDNLPSNQTVRHISSYKLQVNTASLNSPLDFARRIMRKENYLIACMHHAALFHDDDGDQMRGGGNFRVLRTTSPSFTQSVYNRFLPDFLQFSSLSHVIFSRNMECNLNIAIIDRMFEYSSNNQIKLKRKFFHEIEILKQRLVILGILNLILMPFLLIYRIFHFFFTSAQEWHLHRTHAFGTRRWSSFAKWKFREYNELPHVLEARMARSYHFANKYLSLFPGTGAFAIFASGVSFCSSSIMAVLVAVSLLEESILLETTINDRQLLWYLTIATGIFALSRSFTSSAEMTPSAAAAATAAAQPLLQPQSHGIQGSPDMNVYDEAMLQLASETHYFPQEWRGKCDTFDVRDELLKLFPYKMFVFLQECLSVICAPYFLCFYLRQNIEKLLYFIQEHTNESPFFGAVCDFGEFDFKKYQHDFKMEKSFINFKQMHPNWKGPKEGEEFYEKLERLKEEEMEKSLMLMSMVSIGGATPQHATPHANNNHNPMMGLHASMSMSHNLMQSQAIRTALGNHQYGGIGGGGIGMQENEFYWLEKLHQQGVPIELDQSLTSSDIHEEMKGEH